jgi:DNA polymerase-1
MLPDLLDARLIFHNAPNDYRVLAALVGWEAMLNVWFEDTMLMAYLLGQFVQGLKPLGFRQGIRLQDYADLLQPLDNQRVRLTLQDWHDAHHRHRNIPRRVFTSVRGILDKHADRTPRQRWTASKFAPHCPLPPEPTWKDLPPDVGIPYACGDAHGHRALYQTFWPQIKAQGLDRAYRIDRDVLPMVARMEHVGMAVDGDTLAQIGRALDVAYGVTCQQIEDVLGYPLNPKASEEVSHTLFDELGVTPTKPTKSGKHYTTQDKYLEARKAEHEVIPLIMRGREEHKLKSSYAAKLPGLLVDGRYYPHFAYTRAASGRLTEPIILLIPKHGGHLPECEVWQGQRCTCVPWSKRIRRAFRAAPGHVLVSVALSQIELRVLADNSRDRALLDAYRSGRDLHAETAHDLLGAPKRKEDQDESKHRLPAKKGNFGAFMGLSPAGLTEQIRAGGNVEWADGCPGCDDVRADHRGDCDSVVFFREYFKKYRGIKQHIETKHAEAERDGFVRDMWGAKIYVHGIWSTKFGIRKEAQRKAQATPIQAGADRLSKVWMRRIWEEILVPEMRRKRYYCEPWCRVHDDTILEVDERIAARVARQMQALIPQKLTIAVESEAKMGTEWGGLK